MPDGLLLALGQPGLALLLLTALLAGVVYGFAGFGAALIFLPVGARILPPEAAVAAFSLAGLASVVTMLPRTWREADRVATSRMILAALAAMPLGVWLLRQADPVPIRWAICLLVAVTLLAVLAGWRMRLPPGPGSRLGLGAAAGAVGGATGLLGPVVILVTLATGEGARQMRANLASFLTVVNAALLPMLWLQGALTARAAWIGLLLLPVYMAGTVLGAALFRPRWERLYRGLAHGTVAVALVAGLPLFG